MKADTGAAPQVSIIVPVYNVEAYLRRCLNSILAQTLEEWECICVDDGSPDACGAILDEYAAKDVRFVVIHQENRGVSVARNAGIEAARGEYIGFVDPDDWIEANTYEVALKAARETDADIVQWGIVMQKESGAVLSTEKGETFSGVGGYGESPVRDNAVYNKLFKSAFLAENSLRFLAGVRCSEDFYFSLMAYGHCKKGVFINMPLYHYDQTRSTSVIHNAPSAVMQESNEARKSEIEAMLQIEQMVKEQGVTVIAGGGLMHLFLGQNFALKAKRFSLHPAATTAFSAQSFLKQTSKYLSFS